MDVKLRSVPPSLYEGGTRTSGGDKSPPGVWVTPRVGSNAYGVVVLNVNVSVLE